MVDIFNEVVLAILTGVGVLILYFLLPFFVGWTVMTIIVKTGVILLILYLGDQFTSFLMDMITTYMPIQNELTAFSCQIGIFAGLDLFFKIVFTAYISRWIFKAAIEA